MKINWTSNAKKTFEQILDWLSGNWTNREVENFLDQTDSTIDQSKNKPNRENEIIKSI